MFYAYRPLAHEKIIGQQQLHGQSRSRDLEMRESQGAGSNGAGASSTALVTVVARLK